MKPIIAKVGRGHTIQPPQLEKNYACNRCGKMYNTSGGLNKHMQNHTGQFTYYCEKCKEEYNYKTNYKVHMDNHAEKGIMLRTDKDFL